MKNAQFGKNCLIKRNLTTNPANRWNLSWGNFPLRCTNLVSTITKRFCRISECAGNGT